MINNRFVPLKIESYFIFNITMKRFLKVGLLRLRAPNYVQSLAPASVWKNYNQVNIDSFTK